MKRSLVSSVLVLVVLLGVPAAVSAQEFRNMELNPFVAWSESTRSNFEVGFPQSITPIQEQFRLNDTLRGGVRFNVNTTGHWGEEIFFSYEPNHAHFARRATPNLEQTYDIRVYNAGVNVMYYVNEDEGRRTRPFFSAGIGARVDQPTGPAKQVANDPLRGNLLGFETSGEFAFNYGAGIKHNFTDTFGLRVDARGFISRNPSFGLPRNSTNPNAVVFPASGAIQTVELSAGIVFRFRR